MAEAATDFYDILGTRPQATETEVRQAYRRAARHWHPDKAHAADKELAERRFKEIAAAYAVLSDSKQRKLYDLYLRCRPYGYFEVPVPEDPRGSYAQVTFADWNEFRQLLQSSGLAAPGERWAGGTTGPNGEGATDDPAEAQLTLTDWLLAGGVVAVLWCIAVWHHQRREWLKALPLEIWRVHTEYATPLGLLLSPFFFGNVPFRDAAEWLRGALDGEFSD
mmetsp:Transcript_34846/g.76013  ORF Transcript_34846/g.76013 Transcript_34846/m.76013 type:complete len:221 (-) Transcript_34846:163-825(-)|eukprot:CAMPEP_0170614310 /NCGR_PEP_ID=MMETSP0224-20130122/24731_1 /TAXON_ID=285029 /ORGANISM="Togula jolla, Strain CCCM 725" /LENGTH=220 /DNA_ID=CAMNT_0010939957 /DNA_START=113 /DNA_END=775 /DNA_ORIENTATION=+